MGEVRNSSLCFARISELGQMPNLISGVDYKCGGLFVAQGYDWVHAGGSHGWEQAGDNSYCGED
jgi:hypothetical protein